MLNVSTDAFDLEYFVCLSETPVSEMSSCKREAENGGKNREKTIKNKNKKRNLGHSTRKAGIIILPF